MRWKIGISIFLLSIPLWIGSLIVSPYTTWGVEQEQIRPGVARLIGQFATISFALSVASGLTVYYRSGNIHRWSGIAFAPFLLFFGGTALARSIWIWFDVLG